MSLLEISNHPAAWDDQTFADRTANCFVKQREEESQQPRFPYCELITCKRVLRIFFTIKINSLYGIFAVIPQYISTSTIAKINVTDTNWRPNGPNNSVINLCSDLRIWNSTQWKTPHITKINDQKTAPECLKITTTSHVFLFDFRWQLKSRR